MSKLFKLHPYDVLSIKPIPLWREGESIELKGEFRFPGVYSIKDGETLYDTIQRAGGLTEQAFLMAQYFLVKIFVSRKMNKETGLLLNLESDLANASLSANDPSRCGSG